MKRKHEEDNNGRNLRPYVGGGSVVQAAVVSTADLNLFALKANVGVKMKKFGDELAWNSKVSDSLRVYPVPESIKKAWSGFFNKAQLPAEEAKAPESTPRQLR
ncbi:hypothetical protein BN59_00733 [Legionella massiliensis]|uniref:Uncharacterized protein n=1 Tax=Legionella massiliensis TaxID=1034943 RepID=A0A078KXI1_9GAMM|nr:hypothetical protein [Legionella massiliensis]CDZ76464.1 hypothetical protein BN59_00733 [Legionella massiliensis]CEE12202.1 hypothetical protein BN1094_00733 [Legionella massiliensis]